jgi:hypothetical protein
MNPLINYWKPFDFNLNYVITTIIIELTMFDSITTIKAKFSLMVGSNPASAGSIINWLVIIIKEVVVLGPRCYH